MDQEILKLVRKKGLLLEKDLFDLLGNFEDVDLAKNFLDNLERDIEEMKEELSGVDKEKKVEEVTGFSDELS